MPEVPVPVIREEHYQAFLALPTAEMPETFDEWRNERAQDERNFIMSNFTVDRIEIYPEEFAKFCRERVIPMNFHAIKALVEEKSRRKPNAESNFPTTGPSKREVKIIESPEC